MDALDLPEEDAPIPVLEPGTEGVWTTFPQTMEHLRAGKAIIVITLDRETGLIEIDEDMSTPAETAWMLQNMSEDHDGLAVGVLSTDEDDDEDD